MSHTNYWLLKLKSKMRGKQVKKLTIVTLLCILFLNFFYFFNNTNQHNSTYYQPSSQNDNELISLESSAGIELFQDPFTINFEKMWQFFETNYLSSLDLNVDTYYREGDDIGTITDDKIYPVDNLLLYNTILKSETNASETFRIYQELRKSPLWYNSESSQFDYGFVSSVDNSTGDVFDSTRYLIDNLMPIFLLIDNIGSEINTINIDGIYPKDSIEEIFSLVNSTEFWDNAYNGFSDHNTTDFSEPKFTESNLYAILALLKIRHIYEELNLNSAIKNRAYELANITMDVLIEKMWDNSFKGFYYNAENDWTVYVPFGNYKYLNVNALGIITLLEYWVETGMTNTSLLSKAIEIYNQINQTLWTTQGFQYYGDSTWSDAGADANRIDLEANALMMLACLKLFELSGNDTYYNQALFIHKNFENIFYDASVNAYDTSKGTINNQDKNLNSNLRLVDSYLKAFELYNSTVLISEYNITEITPNFIFNQDDINITSNYAIKKDNYYFNTSTNSYEIFTLNYSISLADITYVFKYPNGTLFETIEQQITGDNITLLFDINQSLPIGSGYYLHIYSNKTNFGMAYALKRFNVVSGLINSSILGLPNTVYQGPTYNITLPVNNTRNNNVTLTVSMEGDDINEKLQIVDFNSMVLTNVSFNLTTLLDANVGPHVLNFTFREGNILYLEIIKVIEIGYSFDYTNFLYYSQVVSGNELYVSMNVINFLPNSTQSLNISFSGDYVQDLKDEINLNKNEIRTVSYNLLVSDDLLNDMIEIQMEISKGNTVFYTKLFNIKIIPKFEILYISFPSIIPQGKSAFYIITIKNNQEISELFSLYVNGIEKATNLNGLAPGENRIEVKVLPTINPYDFQSKTYTFTLKDSSGEIICQHYFEVNLQLSTFNLITFYLLPIILPISIIFYYKNKEIKHRMLRR